MSENKDKMHDDLINIENAVEAKQSKKTKRKVKAWVIWGMLASFLCGAAVASLIFFVNRDGTPKYTGTAAGYGVSEENDYPDRVNYCNHWKVIKAGYDYLESGVTFMYDSDGNDEYDTNGSLEDMQKIFSEYLTSKFETLEEANGKTMVIDEYRYCDNCCTWYYYGKTTLTAIKETTTVTKYKDAWDSDEWDEIWYWTCDDEGLISYSLRVNKDMIFQLFTDIWESITGNTESYEEKITYLTIDWEEEPLYTVEEYDEILQQRWHY